jgi:hypothetical protein
MKEVLRLTGLSVAEEGDQLILRETWGVQHLALPLIPGVSAGLWLLLWWICVKNRRFDTVEAGVITVAAIVIVLWGAVFWTWVTVSLFINPIKGTWVFDRSEKLVTFNRKPVRCLNDITHVAVTKHWYWSRTGGSWQYYVKLLPSIKPRGWKRWIACSRQDFLIDFEEEASRDRLAELIGNFLGIHVASDKLPIA